MSVILAQQSWLRRMLDALTSLQKSGLRAYKQARATRGDS